MNPLRVALCGNPNVGKSTVFNALTGMRQHTGNWAGKTVESARGQVRGEQQDWTLVDLPGAYSLLDGSPEEVVASDYLNFMELDAAVVVCDATCLERSLNLALQVSEACPRAVLCVNLMDEAVKRGIQIDIPMLETLLCMPVVGVTAKKKQGLKELKRRVLQAVTAPDALCESAVRLCYPQVVERAAAALCPALLAAFPRIQGERSARFAALRLLVGGERFLRRLLEEARPEGYAALCEGFAQQRAALEAEGYVNERLAAELITEGYRVAGRLCEAAVKKPEQSSAELRQLRVDRVLSSKRVGIPLMLGLLALVFYITISGANIPSAWLSAKLMGLEPMLRDLLASARAPAWLIGLLVDGVYRVVAWVVSVMLPPMAIFFPLFTLLEDFGFLPRVAFNLDCCFQHCCACGKQALCMMQGFGCNAVGVMGCRIIQSPRERLIAILTNALVPCNGRFPTLIALISMFFVFSSGAIAPILCALALVGLIVLSVLMTFASSKLLSKTVLKGIPSSFSLELPPFRRPKIAQVLVRSVLDRTLFVLGRAVAVAAPAGLCLWVLANVTVNGTPLIRLMADFLNPFGRLLGMDGVIVLAFILGFPANEIVLPIAIMVYLSQGALIEPQGFDALRALLVSNGWTVWTAASMMLFCLFHWPCSTTVLTIYKETKSARWTLLSMLLPTAIGCVACALLTLVSRLF
ncbi:MAG: ferrous iron transport protein B [Clostridia bacterium]